MMSTDNTYKSKQVFNYIFDKAQSEGVSLTPMKALKIVYFAHAWTLGFTGKPLLTEPVQAWQYGAVVPSLYHDLKLYGSGEIKHAIVRNQQNYILALFAEDYDSIPDNLGISFNDLHKDETDIINSVWNAYKGLTAGKLSNIMHQPGTPWSETYRSGRSAIIPNALIESHYKEKIKNASTDKDAK